MGDRHLVGAGAAACAVCCAPPLMAAIGIVGGAATLATALFAGIVFAIVVAAATLAVAWQRRRGRPAAECDPDLQPVQEIELLPTRLEDRS